jgi:hypothetical protein
VLALWVLAGLAFPGGAAVLPASGPSCPVLDDVSEALARPAAEEARWSFAPLRIT